VTRASAPAGHAGAHLIRIPRARSSATYRPDIITEIRRRRHDDRAIRPNADSGFTPDIPVVLKGIARRETGELTGTAADVALVSPELRTSVAARRAVPTSRSTARAVFPTPRRAFAQDGQARFAKSDRAVSKDQILTLYCNQINLGHGNYGAEAAARYYFGVPGSSIAQRSVSRASSSARRNFLFLQILKAPPPRAMPPA
jgi:hypothetical protein